MVFESRVGETFVLGASSWRIEEITHDRVLVSPAPGEPGKMPFWKGDRAGRPLELGLAIGRLMHDLLRAAAAGRHRPADARPRSRRARRREPAAVPPRPDGRGARASPTPATIVIERVRDELGDWRVCVLSPRGGRIHAPWAMAAAAKIREETGVDVETLWGDDGFVVRFPDVDQPPDPRLLLPDPDEVQALVVRQLGATALFAAKFRENAARSLLLPKRRPGHARAALAAAQARRRSAGGRVALRIVSRSCSRPIASACATSSTCRRSSRRSTDVRSRKIRVATVDSETAVAVCRVAALQLRRELSLRRRRAAGRAARAGARRRSGAAARAARRRRAARAARRRRDGGDRAAAAAARPAVPRQERRRRARHAAVARRSRRTTRLPRARATAEVAGERRTRSSRRGACCSVRIAGERALHRGRGRGALSRRARRAAAAGPSRIAARAGRATRSAISRCATRARTRRSPPPTSPRGTRSAPPPPKRVLIRLTGEGRLLEGEFRPGGTRREWTDPGVLRMLRRRSLAKLRHEVEPVDQAVLGRFATTWQGVVKRRRGADALLDVIEQLQGAPLPASILETEILPARLDALRPGRSRRRDGGRRGRLGRRRAARRTRRPDRPVSRRPRRAACCHRRTSVRATSRTRRTRSIGESGRRTILDYLRGARRVVLRRRCTKRPAAAIPAETVDALWNLVWRGAITNDTFHALRAFTRGTSASPPRQASGRARRSFRSRRLAPPSAEGRWSLVRRGPTPRQRDARSGPRPSRSSC